MYIYYIQNTTNEYGNTTIRGYFSSLKKAKEHLKYCYDWYREHGTGKIFKIAIDVPYSLPCLVYEN